MRGRVSLPQRGRRAWTRKTCDVRCGASQSDCEAERGAMSHVHRKCGGGERWPPPVPVPQCPMPRAQCAGGRASSSPLRDLSVSLGGVLRGTGGARDARSICHISASRNCAGMYMCGGLDAMTAHGYAGDGDLCLYTYVCIGRRAVPVCVTVWPAIGVWRAPGGLGSMRTGIRNAEGGCTMHRPFLRLLLVVFVKHTALVEPSKTWCCTSWVVLTPKQAYCCASCPSRYARIHVAPGMMPPSYTPHCSAYAHVDLQMAVQ
ncbi:hypothetical protein C8Q74DRAFT_867915 [Fomes fomentarius]|nr:hypothetical protein C8Q74DRAFT_867915 [Fomes fomentarius]